MLRLAQLAVLLGAVACAGPQSVPAASPAFHEVRAAHQPSDRRLLDRHGDTLHVRRVDLRERRLDWVPLSDVSPAMIDVIVAAEDHRFWTHDGVDPRALVAALAATLRDGRRGGSTITMQLATLIDPRVAAAKPGSVTRKLQQLRAAWALERSWTKNEILEAYVNLVPFRGELRGLAAATELHFGVAPAALTRTQSVALAATLPAPNAAAEAIASRARRLADRIGAVDPLALTDALERLSAPPRPTTFDRRDAPHLAVRLLRGQGGAPLPTTLDGTLQRVAVQSLTQHVQELATRGVRDGAVLIADNATGDVLAYVGSSGSLSPARHVDGVRALRQAGSTLKPFLYAIAVDRRRLTAASLLDDVPLELFLDVGSYRPTNYDDRYHGRMTLRTALARSRNVPAVALLQRIGGEVLLDHLHRLGIESLRQSAQHYGPGLALGSGEVSLWELVAAYRALASGGTYAPLRLRPEEAVAPATRVFGAEAAFVIGDILADREARAGVFGLDGALTTPFWAAVKTGTSTDMRDNWCVGYSRRYTVGVWVGNFSGAPMGDVSGVTGAAPIWADLMRWLHRNEPSMAPEPPAGVVAATVVLPEGRTVREWFLKGTEPASAQVVAATRPARIVAPVDGALLALDPGIPATAQRVAFVARGVGAGSEWWLDGKRLAPADEPYLWEPAAGRHQLELRAAAGRTLDTVQFRVR